ncbi:MAG TPA: SDR family oxidoreductase [Bryobacteraceae bacterium]|nr:SDR family oxidoreductase [Bryobacteraceae bacterium]
MVAFVTGGGRGIGRGIALGLAKTGWSVVVTSRTAGELDETVSLSRASVIAIPADVADPAEVRGMVRHAQEQLGPIDLLVNNAGMGAPIGPFWQTDAGEWWRNQEVNLRGPMLCCHEVLPGMIARKAGRIVNIVSGAGCQPFPELSAYVVSKTALVRFSEQLAMEVAPHGISVFPVRPGTVRTSMVEEARQRLPYIQQILDRGLDVTPEIVANLVLKLASGAADALSGRLFSVNEDMDEIVRQAEEIKTRDLYVLRCGTL